VVVLVVLELQREKERVREVCEDSGKEKVQRRGPKLTVTGDGIGLQWRRGGLWLQQPGGVIC
jgi:hypothetical protein